jgi:hypothetical protein
LLDVNPRSVDVAEHIQCVAGDPMHSCPVSIAQRADVVDRPGQLKAQAKRTGDAQRMPCTDQATYSRRSVFCGCCRAAATYQVVELDAPIGDRGLLVDGSEVSPVPRPRLGLTLWTTPFEPAWSAEVLGGILAHALQ